MAKRSLESAGYCVLCAADGEAGLRVAQQNRIDLLISDVLMPSMNGHELATRVQELQPKVRVLFISGYDGGIDAGSYHHPQHVLQKPFSGIDLSLKVREVLDFGRQSAR